MTTRALASVLTFMIGIIAFSLNSARADSAQSNVSSENKTIADGEILAKVMAIDANEIRAAEQAQKKKIRSDVLAYAKMLHKDHTKDEVALIKLGQAIQVAPAETPAVDQMKANGAGELAKIMPLTGKHFETAYLNMMVKGHSDALSLIDSQLIPSANSPALKKQLAETRAHVALHLDRAKKLQQAVS